MDGPEQMQSTGSKQSKFSFLWFPQPVNEIFQAS
ncbi:unnamed protein product [Musa acuminata subsp. malaccensis]|uniref:(wild Malaysian banana) hypothetical protein n=1 Tax=Musa acuminata subsp. malaccensis TaxID=214687 RepID=A0A804K311_MUSAM|nr:unnamed protein product [Musa acuminata subsp. malaccensis]